MAHFYEEDDVGISLAKLLVGKHSQTSQTDCTDYTLTDHWYGETVRLTERSPLRTSGSGSQSITNHWESSMCWIWRSDQCWINMWLAHTTIRFHAISSSPVAKFSLTGPCRPLTSWSACFKVERDAVCGRSATAAFGVRAQNSGCLGWISSNSGFLSLLSFWTVGRNWSTGNPKQTRGKHANRMGNQTWHLLGVSPPCHPSSYVHSNSLFGYFSDHMWVIVVCLQLMGMRMVRSESVWHFVIFIICADVLALGKSSKLAST